MTTSFHLHYGNDSHTTEILDFIQVKASITATYRPTGWILRDRSGTLCGIHTYVGEDDCGIRAGELDISPVRGIGNIRTHLHSYR